MESKNEIKRLTFYIWGQWLIIIGLLLISTSIMRLDMNKIEKNIDDIQKSIVSQQEACNGVVVKLDDIDHQVKEIRKTIGGEW